jgi:hypothetical protein
MSLTRPTALVLLAEWTYSMRAVILPTLTTTPNAFFSTTSGALNPEGVRCLR